MVLRIPFRSAMHSTECLLCIALLSFFFYLIFPKGRLLKIFFFFILNYTIEDSFGIISLLYILALSSCIPIDG